MKSQRRPRPVRPLTIYGFRRKRSKSRRIWLGVAVLASLSLLPRVLSPIAEKLWGTSTHSSAPRARTPVAARPPIQEPGTAFAAPEPQLHSAALEPQLQSATPAVADSIRPAITRAQPAALPASPGSNPPSAAPIHARAHRARSRPGKGSAVGAKPAGVEETPAPAPPSENRSRPSGPGLVPPPQ